MAEQAPRQVSFSFGPVRILRDRTLGTGSYGQVCKAMLGELPCAAKLLHPTIVDPSNPRNGVLFVQECRFLSQIHHPNIVQYLGTAQDRSTGLPILLMELMDDSLTHFLEQSEVRLPYHVQVNINYDIAQALAFLHANQILHRDLSSNNVLLIGDGARAKVTDFGMSKLTTLNPRMTPLTTCPGTPAYMSPEAMLDPPVYTEKLDCFQAGVLMVQTITRKFPDPGPSMNRVRDDRSRTGWVNVPVPETQRRENHLRLVTATHPMYPLIVDCLKDTDTQRPSAQQICHRLSGLRDTPQYQQSHKTRGGGGEREREIQERDQLIQQFREENETREEREREKERQRELEIQSLRQSIEQQQNTIRELRESVNSKTRLIQEKDWLQKEEILVQKKDATIHRLQQSQQLSYTSQVSGPGLQSATVNHSTHVMVELSDSSSRPASLPQNVTAQLETVLEEVTPTKASRRSRSKKAQKQVISVAMTTPSRYEVSYTAVSRGQHKLHVQVNAREISGSPFTITVYPDPTQLGRPVRTVTGLSGPYGIAFNSRGEMVVAESGHSLMSVINISGQRIMSFGSKGSGPEDMIMPAGIAIDDKNNVYVSSQHKLQKFTSSGELIKCVGQIGCNEIEFNDPRGVTLYNDQVYVCDSNNHRIQVFDPDLNFVGCIGSYGRGRGEFDAIDDVKFDGAGNMYVAEYSNKRVQVLDSSGHFIQTIGEKGEGKLPLAFSLLVADRYIYVATNNRINVYKTSGQFVTSFGRLGQKQGEFRRPFYITSCTSGYIYVADNCNNRVQIF